MTEIYVSAAEAARWIRGALKEAFPQTRFSVTCQNFAGGSSVTIRYSGRPEVQAVRKIAESFGHRDFDAMEEVTQYVEAKVGARSYSGFVNVSRERDS